MPALQGLDSNAALQFDVAATPTTIGLRRNWSLSNDLSTIDVSTAADAGFANFIAGIKQLTLDAEVLYDKTDATQDVVRVAALAGTTVDVTANIDGEAFTGTGVISTWSVSVPHDDVISVSFSVQFQGAVTFA